MPDHGRRPGGDDFPCASLGEALPHLRRPPTPAAVRFKIQNTVEDAAQVAAYVDARLVFDRLDHVCGERWSAAFDELPAALIPPPVDRNGELRQPPPVYARCRLTLYGVTREDVGEGADPKAAFSDAVKRAAVHFGVGRALYAMRSPWLREGEGNGELRRNRRGKLILDARSEAWCRAMYERWLAERGAKQFGEPLEHGDEPGAETLKGTNTGTWATRQKMREAERELAQQAEASYKRTVSDWGAAAAKRAGASVTPGRAEIKALEGQVARQAHEPQTPALRHVIDSRPDAA
jgi:hypothetical protein